MSTTIHVGNLSFSLSEKDLEEYFSKYGKIVDSYIVRRGGRPRGYGFVEFSSTKEADNALAANGEEYSGRAITIELANGKIVKSNFQGSNNGDDNNGGYNNNRGYNNNGGYRNNNNGGYNNGGYNNGGYRNNNNGGYNNGGYNNGGYRNNNNGGYNNGGYRNNNNGGYNNGGYRNNNYNNGPRSYQNESGKTFYTLNQTNNYGPRRNDNNNNNNGPRRYNNRRPESEKEKSVSTVYVSNLPFSYDEKALATLFDGFQVKTAHVVQTRNGRSRGFGFVEFETEQDQLNAIKSKDQTEVDGRTIIVKVSLVDKNEQSSQLTDKTEQTTQTTTN